MLFSLFVLVITSPSSLPIFFPNLRHQKSHQPKTQQAYPLSGENIMGVSITSIAFSDLFLNCFGESALPGTVSYIFLFPKIFSFLPLFSPLSSLLVRRKDLWFVTIHFSVTMTHPVSGFTNCEFIPHDQTSPVTRSRFPRPTALNSILMGYVPLQRDSPLSSIVRQAGVLTSLSEDLKEI